LRIYLVGGAVRDALLGLAVGERDWVVVGATEAQMVAAGFERLDAGFPVFRHPDTGEEYALARTETKTGPGYKGFETYAGPDVTLEQDLRRRDLTVNAIAQAPDGTLVDPFNGLEDLEQRRLRHVSPAFVEDPVRVLRVARFAAKLGRWGFRVAHGTHRLMVQMAASPDFRALRTERVWRELARALEEPQPWRFFEVLHRCGALEALIPRLAQTLGPARAHEGMGDPTPLAALKRAAAAGGDPTVRFAALMYEAARSDPEALCAELRADRAYCDLLELAVRIAPLIDKGERMPPEDAFELIQAARGLARHERLHRLALVIDAWTPEAPGLAERLDAARDAAASVTAETLSGSGLTGRALGEALAERRIRAIRDCWRGKG
jgi:tRNA nucleotidyltransferase (CCA-adding enzyme)